MNGLVQSKELVKEESGQLWTNSLIVAEEFERRHADVIRSVEDLECSKDFTERNFAFSEYRDSTGRVLPMVKISRDGFMFLAMGFTGQKAAGMKEQFILAFNTLSRPKSMLDIMEMSIKALQEQERRTNENTRQIQSVQAKVEELGASTDQKIKSIEEKLVIDKINQFPEGCRTVEWITENYFLGMNPVRVSNWFKILGHPCKEYQYTDKTGKLFSKMVFVNEGISEVRSRLVRESVFDKDTDINHIYIHPALGRFFVKIISHKPNFMDK